MYLIFHNNKVYSLILNKHTLLPYLLSVLVKRFLNSIFERIVLISFILLSIYLILETEEMPVTRPKLQATSTNQTSNTVLLNISVI